jgi:5-methylcytosine-specific restriction endonuclease McrA
MSLLREPCVICGATCRFHIDYCDVCYEEKDRIRRYRKMSIKAGGYGDLTLLQWRARVSEFQGVCAYCQDRPYQVLEHFIPIVLGGATSLTNCVPACFKCNARKRDEHPDYVTKIPRTDIQRVQTFLRQFSEYSRCRGNNP